MLSTNLRQERISIRKMDGHLLPFSHFQSMKAFNIKVRVGSKAPFDSNQTCIDESYIIISPGKVNCPSNKARFATSLHRPLDCYRSKGKDGNEASIKLIPDNRTKSRQKFYNEATDPPKVLRWGNYLWNSHGLLISLFLSLLIVCANCQIDSNQCAPGLNTPGRTSPSGDIVLEYNESLKIFCILNENLTNSKFDGKNASDLVFFRNDKEMEPEYTTIINSTTILLYVQKLVPSDDMYYCRLRLNYNSDAKYEAVCLNKVVVGFKPQEPRNFSCVSQNWENLICTWDPEPNKITTKFSLRFTQPGRAGGRFKWPCPDQKPRPNACLWNASTDPIYRQVIPEFTFVMDITNVLGSKTVEYPFSHFAHVIPSKPDNLSVVNKTYCSAMLYWSVPHAMRNFPPGLYHRISYQSQYDSRKMWKSIELQNEKRANHIYFNLTDLQYANAVYDIRVFTKSAKASGEDKWSKFSDVTVKTAATLPGRPPKTDIGSFEIAGNSENRDVYIYWQTIPAELENGDNFTYQVVQVTENGKNLDIQPSEKTKTYAKFKGISFESFEFEIVTANCQGVNTQKAVVRVPRRTEKPAEPNAFTKIAFEDGLYELSWIPKESDSLITNYTIFWCENDRDRPYQCTGYLDWIHVPRDISIYNYTVPDPQKIYQFAIAANTANYSSGMVWASCTAIHNKTVGKMKSVWINSITSDKIQVGWKLECSDRIDIIEGFAIYYCPIVSPYNLTCKYPMMNTTVKGDPHTIYGDLSGLKPYTTYMLTVAVLTKNGEGHHSDPLYNTTLEAAPTPPQNVIVRNVTNTTITVEWQPPVAMNGVLRFYTVYCNENSTVVEKNANTSFQIQNLQPYKSYNITVSAQTVMESNRSHTITSRTHIGVPGKIDEPKVTFSNSSQVKVSWKLPNNPGGNLDYYEILAANDSIQTNITKLEKELAIPDCNDVGRVPQYKFQVRAVNFGANGERFKGPWSDPGEGNCFSSRPSNPAWIMIWIIGCFSGFAFLGFLGYSSKRIWIKCKAMQDVEVKLPPGLQPNMKLLGKGNEQHTQQHSADSSGCSSGHESVTSSLTSDSHVSTDSGADLDPVPMSPTKLLESPPTWESSNLRQRIVTGNTKPDSSVDRGQWDSYVKVAKTTDTPAKDSLSLARSTPNLAADGTAAKSASNSYPASEQLGWSSTGYICMPSSSEEDSSINPSPSSRSKGSAQGVYSVVGLAPSPTPCVRRGGESRSMERSHPPTGDLIPIGTETRKQPIVNPYVSLASLEQKPMNMSSPQTSALGDFADIGFAPQVQDPQQLPPYSISDKLSKPYVQTGLMDMTKISHPKKELKDPDSQTIHCIAPTAAELSSGRPPFPLNDVDLSVSSSHQQSLIELPSNTYVPVNMASSFPSPRNTLDPVQIQNPYVAVSTLVPSPDVTPLSNRGISGTAEDIGDHLVSPYSFSPQTADTQDPTTQKLLSHGEPISRSSASVTTSLPVVKQTSGYVTIAENPTRLTDESMSESPYVPHKQVEKKSLPPSYQSNTGQADEQYSKVTVVPATQQKRRQRNIHVGQAPL